MKSRTAFFQDRSQGRPRVGTRTSITDSQSICVVCCKCQGDVKYCDSVAKDWILERAGDIRERKGPEHWFIGPLITAAAPGPNLF